MTNYNGMTLVELQQVLGENIKKVNGSEKLSNEEHRKITKAADTIKGLAEEMIRNANTMLAAEHLATEGAIRGEASISGLLE